jgi:exopolyphosphatase / guanosine-5'-triphosphate,3'-diphosphate pyrophosphatase
VRTAVVDIGSNSTRLLIADIENGRVSEEMVRRTTVTRLGTGVDSSGKLSDEAMERVYATLDEYRAEIDKHDVDRAIAVLTSAVRDAGNGEQFANTVGTRYGLSPHILTGDEEARLTFLGATSERNDAERTPTVVIDIGGGSTELVIGAGREPSFHVSNQAGVVRQTERHLHHDPPESEEREALAADVRAIFERAVPSDQRNAVQHAIAVAGTATSVAAIAQELEPYDPTKVHGYVATVRDCEEMLERLSALPLGERRRVRGLHPDRAPTIVAGVIILIEALKFFGLDDVEISEHDILRGAALGLTG